MSREVASANVMAAEQLIEALKIIIEKGGYSARQIFKVDKTALSLKTVPA